VAAPHPTAAPTGSRHAAGPVTSEPPADSAPRPRTKAAQREATKAALIKAGRELFAEHGYAGVAAEEIVQRAGVSRGALYHHFKRGKEALFRAVLVQISADTARRLGEVVQSPADPWKTLLTGVDTFLELCAEPDVQRIVLIDGPSVLNWDVWRAIDSEYVLELVESVLQRAIDDGVLVAQPARALAQVLLGALHEAAMVVAEAEDPAGARAEMGATVRRLLEGLRAPAA